MFVCSSSGKRIPDVDAAGASTGRGFKLGRQASESHRTCCWWPNLSFPSLYSASPHTLNTGGHQLDGRRKCFIAALNRKIAICCQKIFGKRDISRFLSSNKKIYHSTVMFKWRTPFIFYLLPLWALFALLCPFGWRNCTGSGSWNQILYLYICTHLLYFNQIKY